MIDLYVSRWLVISKKSNNKDTFNHLIRYCKNKKTVVEEVLTYIRLLPDGELEGGPFAPPPQTKPNQLF